MNLWYDSFILSHHLAKFGSHGPRENEDITFFISHVTTVSNCHMTSWVVWGAPILIGLTEVKIMAFIVSVLIPIPMPRFTNGAFKFGHCCHKI